MGIINKTLLEVTTRVWNSAYRKVFLSKEQVWSEDQEVCIDLCSIYTTLEEWRDFIDKHGEHTWSITDLDDYFSIDIAEMFWEKQDQNGNHSIVHVDDIIDVKEAHWTTRDTAVKRAELLAEGKKYPGEEELHAEKV